MVPTASARRKAFTWDAEIPEDTLALGYVRSASGGAWSCTADAVVDDVKSLPERRGTLTADRRPRRQAERAFAPRPVTGTERRPQVKTVSALVVIAILLIAAGCSSHGPYKARTYEPGSTTIEKTERVIMADPLRKQILSSRTTHSGSMTGG